jgi:hypothetical protein
MSADYDNMIGTIPPGVLAPADGNYAPNGAQGESLGTGLAPGFSPASVGDVRSPRDDEGQDAALSVGAPQSDAIADLGLNNERLEDVKPELVNALRELVRQYRQEGIAARRNEIRRIRQARLFWQGLQYAWWNPNDMNWHLPYENRSNDDRELEDMPRYQFVTNFTRDLDFHSSPCFRRMCRACGSIRNRRSRCRILERRARPAMSRI